MSSVLPSSLIILKHSIIEGRVPTSDILEVGELALGLFPGKESIWAKNSSGEVIDMRSPRHDLFWGDLFVKFDTREEFYEAKLAGQIKNTSLVFIKDTCQLWTDGIFYSSSYTEEELEKLILSKVISIPSSVYNLTSESSHVEISNAFGGVDKFKAILEKAKEEGVVSSLLLPSGGQTPVSVICENTENSDVLILDYLVSGNYIKQKVTLENNQFSISKKGANLLNMESRLTQLETRVENIENVSGGEFLWVDITNNN